MAAGHRPSHIGMNRRRTAGSSRAGFWRRHRRPVTVQRGRSGSGLNRYRPPAPLRIGHSHMPDGRRALPLEAIAARSAMRINSPIGQDSRRHLGPSAVPTPHRYRQIVERFDAIARAELGKFRHIPEICDALAVSQRTLARAVRAIHGTTPSRHLHALALAEARTALLDNATASVRQVALRLGFRELGRFAALYREAFGENPSETLRRNTAARHAAGDEPGLCSDS